MESSRKYIRLIMSGTVDIHAVVASIAELNELDVSDLRLAVIFKLLVSAKQQTQLEDDDSVSLRRFYIRTQCFFKI